MVSPVPRQRSWWCRWCERPLPPADEAGVCSWKTNWFKGKKYRKHPYFRGKSMVSPFRQSIDSYLLDRGCYIYIYIYVCVTHQSIAVLVSIMSGFTMGLWTSTNGGGKTKQHLFYIHLYINIYIYIYNMYIIILYHIASLEHMLQTYFLHHIIQQGPAVSQQLSPSNLHDITILYHHYITNEIRSPLIIIIIIITIIIISIIIIIIISPQNCRIIINQQLFTAQLCHQPIYGSHWFRIRYIYNPN